MKSSNSQSVQKCVLLVTNSTYQPTCALILLYMSVSNYNEALKLATKEE